MSQRTKRLLAGYAVAVAVILGGLALLLAGNKDGLLAGFVGAVLPDSLVDVGVMLAEQYVANHLPAVVTLLVTVCVALVPAFVFPLKEILSASYEKDIDPMQPGHPEFPLWLQAFDEACMVAIMGALALAAFRIAVTPGFETIGMVLANVVLAATAAVDFIGPTLMRRGRSPVDTYRIVLTRYPLHAVAFGGIMAVVTTLAAKLITWGVFPVGIGAVFLILTYTAVFSAAVLIGTRTAANMKTGTDMPLTANMTVLALMVGLLSFNAFFFGGVAQAVYHASPVLKCQWKLVDNTLDFGRPTFKDPAIKLDFDVTITNPTDRTAKVKAGAVVSLVHNKDSVATTNVPAFEVGPGESVTQHIAFKVAPKGGIARKGLGLLNNVRKGGVKKALWGAAKSAVDRKAYRAVLTLPVPTGSLVVTLYDGSKEN